jgi:two-component system sensor histidine kinase KdpD
LRIYLGASPGVGKTYAMLDEGRRRKERGADVVVGVVETHGRVKTAAQIGDLEVVPRRMFDHRGALLADMDLDAVLRRRPAIVLVDEFAHTNAPGSRHEKRWQDVQELLDAGIDVISTLNIQHLESLNDVVAKITGVTQRETVPDAVVRRADQIELVDMSPEALRRRMAHGNIYPAERIDAALSNFFRPGNLGALRELALLWVADRVEESLTAYLADHGIADAWETRERVVVGISGAPGGEALIRRAARIAGRVGGDLVGVHVAADDGLSRQDESAIAAQRLLVESLGGRTHEVVGHDRAATLVAFAQSEKATQLVIGATRRDRWYEYWHGSLVGRVTRLARNVDVHVIGHDELAEESRRERRVIRGRSVIDIRRTILAWVITIAGLPALTAVVNHFSGRIELSTELLLFLSLVIAVSALGGRLVAAVAAISASLLVNWWFVEPKYTFTIAEAENLVALVVFVAVALTVGAFVDLSARRSLEARRARAEAGALARSAASLAADPDPVPSLLDQLRRTFALDGVRIVSVRSDGESEVMAESGQIDRVAMSIDLHPDDDGGIRRLELSGRALTADDRRMIGILGDQLVIAIDTQVLASEAAHATALSEVDAVRTALLRAVSHDLRTPLAAIKAMVSGVLDPSAEWTDEQLHEALVAVDQETDRLNRLVGNLLDASRLQIGALAIQPHPSVPASIVTAALQSLGADADRVVVDLDPALPEVYVDPALLERSLANVISNAVRYSHDVVVVGADDARGLVRVTGGVVDDRLHLSVIDRGPGIPVSERTKVMAPFQRLGDTNTSDGVGLGLSITRGFLEAMHGSLRLEDTPGGGLTATLVLPLADLIDDDVPHDPVRRGKVTT